MLRSFKRLTGIVFVLVLMLTFVVGMEAAAKQITILQTSDIHGNIYPWSYKTGEEDDDAGLAKVYTYVKQVREENPNTLLIDSGDTIQGTTLIDIFNNRPDLEHPMMKVMNYMKYDAWTLGNHEFNFGLEILKRAMDDAEFPVLSANITYKADGSNFARPYIIKEVDGVKVGILGLSTPNIPRWDGDKVAELSFAGMSATAKKYIPEMKKKGADIIIAIAHAGLDGRYDPNGGDKVSKVAEENPEIAALFIGHDHDKVNEVVNGVLVMAPEDMGDQVVRVDLELAQENGKWVVKDKQGQHLEAYKIDAAPEVLEVAREYHQATVDFVNTPIGTATGDFAAEDAVRDIPTAQIEDTALVDLINKVQLKYTGADISSAALFTSDSNILEGPVSIKDAARIYKYTNTLYGVEVTGKELKNYMEWSAAYYNTYQTGDVTISFNPDIRGYNFDMFQGVDYKIDISKPAGQRITDLKYQGQPVRDDQTFKLAVNNYRYSGMKADGIFHNDPYFKSEEPIRDFIIEYIKEKKVINPDVDYNWEVIGANLNHWAKAEAIELLNRGILEIPSGNRSWNASSLNLNARVTKDKLVKALGRIFSLEQPAEVEEQSVTRGEAAVMMIKAMNLTGADTAVLAKFSDGQSMDKADHPYLARAVEMGLLNGYSNNKLAPNAVMTMGELASMLHNYLAKYNAVNVLTTNDFHGNLEGGYEAGAAKLAAVIDYYRQANPEGTILLDAGDAYQGTPVSTLNHGTPVVELYNYLGYTAQAVGNHEFDWGIEVLKQIKDKAEYALLSANIYNKNTGKRVDWTKPYIIKDVNGIKVGIIGITTPDTASSTMPSNIAELEFRNPVEEINKLAPQLRAKGADLVLVLGHLPGTMDFETGKVSGELVDTAKLVTDVDGIIGGHSHHTVTGVVNDVPVVEAYKNGRELGNLRYYISSETGKIYRAESVTYAVRKTNLTVDEDQEVAALVKKYQEELEPIMGEVLTSAEQDLTRNYEAISSLGAIITDSMRKDAAVDIAFQNPGGIRVDIPAGKVTVGDLYRLLPFGNTIVVGEMSGAQIVEILEQSFTLEKGMMQLSGLKVKYDLTKPEYSRVVEVTLPDGTPLAMDKNYQVATNNFLAEGGDLFSTFAEVEFTDSYKTVRDAVIEYLRSTNSVNNTVDDRVIEVNNQASAGFAPAA